MTIQRSGQTNRIFDASHDVVPTEMPHRTSFGV
jgi:hypothetical protein